MRENYTLTRLFISVPLTQDAVIALTKEQAHYLGTVLRKSVGDAIRVFNGEGGEWRAEIMQLSRKGGEIALTDQLRVPASAPDIWLCFAPVRKHRTAFIIEKGTELGASEFHPIITERTQFPRLNTDKARLQAVEAAEQPERLDVPTVHDVRAGGIDALLQGWDETRLLLLIGPEGGFTTIERDVLRAQSYVRPVSLGPRILRADTAALSMLTLWQAACGDWE